MINTSLMQSDNSIFPIAITVLAGMSLIACLICIYIVFIFGRKLETSAYLRSYLIESVTRQELSILEQELLNRAKSGPLDPANPPPNEFGLVGQLYDPSFAKFQEKYEGDSVHEATLKRCEDWAKDERKRYEAEYEKVEKKAKQLAHEKVPKSIDISLLGGGWSFLLEFSTIIVIIFSLLILGVLGVMEGREIATIMAAIAGYVLGKASSINTERESNLRPRIENGNN